MNFFRFEIQLEGLELDLMEIYIGYEVRAESPAHANLLNYVTVEAALKSIR